MEPGLRVARGAHDFAPTTYQFGVALADFVRCPACGHLQVDPMPDRIDYEDTVSDHYEREEAGQRATARGVLDRIERHVPQRGRLLDYGAWVGFLGSEAAARGWEVAGVEPSRWAADRARGRGVEIVAPEDLDEGAFSAIVLGDVIEHLTDLAAEIERLSRLLTASGVIWIATPDAGSRVARVLGRRWWAVVPTHVHLFTRPSIRALLERHGLELLAMRTSPKTFSVGYYLDRVGGYSPALSRALVTAGRVAGVAEREWTPDFRDRFEVVARRRAAAPRA
jgi:SAM-dependent methyltransferase